MKKLILLILMISVIASLGISYGRGTEDVNYIDVKIGKTYSLLERARISSINDIYIYQKELKKEAMTKLPEGALYISLSFNSNDDIDVYDDSNTYVTTLPANGTILFGGEEEDYLIEVNGKPYRGYISFIGDKNGLKVINHIDFENYLYGVVPKEIPPMSGKEALKAQAVAARSYAYSAINKHFSEGFNVCDTTHCQVYGGQDCEHLNTTKAVDETIGLVAMHNGNIANTVFHSSSGGYTESSENIWGGKLPYLLGKEDKYSLNTVNSTWVVEIDKDKLSKTFQAGGVNIGEIINVDIIDKTQSGRVKELLVIGSKGDTEITGERFRTILGNTNIKSTLFTIDGYEGITEGNEKAIYAATEKRVQSLETDRGRVSIISSDGKISNNTNKNLNVISDSEIVSLNTTEFVDISRGSVVISGRGYGHGIGMSQYGAMEMAKQGFDFEEILKYYYTDIEIRKY